VVVVNQRCTSPSKLAIVVLNWNGASDTVECLESLLNAGLGESEIVVVDNGSTDGSVTSLVAWAAERGFACEEGSWLTGGRYDLEGRRGNSAARISLIETGANLGFSGGNNVGIRYALERGAGWVLLLNNDTVVEPDCLRELMPRAEQAGVAISGGMIYEHANPSRLWFGGGKFSWWRDRMVRSTAGSPPGDGLLDTDWITGCCLLVRKDVFDDIGLLDESAFLYGEDVDFCRRAAKASYRRCVVLNARIYHKVSRSSVPDSPLMWYHFTKSRLYFHRKHHSALLHGVFLSIYVCTRLGRMLLWLVRGRRDLIRATLSALRDAYLRGQASA